MTGCPCTYGPDVSLALHDGHCCYLPADESPIPPWPAPLPCGHDDRHAIDPERLATAEIEGAP